jgi:DNA-binding response OmpR family regulator
VRREVWTESGTTIDMAHRAVLWELLAALAERGGRATNEELVGRVWNERSYHPLRHDNRLRVSVRKLREAIEDEPAAPAKLITTGDGYALGQGARLR